MIVSFDGANCTGKTAYVKEFSKLFGIKILDSGRYPPYDDGNLSGISQFDIDKKQIAEVEVLSEIIMDIKLSEDFILDRFYLSGYVYSILKKSCLIDKKFISHVEGKIMGGVNKFINVYLCAPVHVLNARRAVAGETFVSDSECIEELYYYTELLMSTIVPTITFDTTYVLDIDRNLSNLYNFINNHGGLLKSDVR